MRWKGFITLIVIFAVASVFSIFFLDNFIECAIEKAGTALWSAKVEVEEVEVKWSPLGIKLLGFTMASKKDEYKNLINIKNINLSVLTAPLFEKKIIIREALGEGLAFNTARETSGFLPEKVKEKRKETKDKWKTKMSSWMEDIKKRGREKIDVSGIFKKEELKSLKAIKEIENSFSGLKDKYSKFKNLDVNKTSMVVSEKVRALDGIKIKNAKDIDKARKKIAEAQDAMKQADKLRNDISNTMREFETSVSNLKAEIKNIDEMRKADYKNMMKKLKLPSIEIADIAETVFGPLVAEKVKTLTAYIEKIRKYIPPKKKKEEVIKKPRKQGTDIIFTREKSYPPFHLMKALISGENNAQIEAEDFTTTPWILGKPAIIRAAYKDIKLNVTIDRTKDTPSETLYGSCGSFKIADSTGVLNIKAGFKGEEIDSEIIWKGRGILPENWLEYLKLEDPLVTLQVSARGEKDNPKFSIKSNLDKIISDQLKAQLEKKMEEAKKKVNGLLNSEVLTKKKKLESDINSFRSKKTAYLNKEKQKIENKKKELNNKANAKQKEIEKKLKKDAEDLLKKKKKEAEDKLKKLFK